MTPKRYAILNFVNFRGMKQHSILPILATVMFTSFSSCKHDGNTPSVTTQGNFPSEISAILVSKCATAGCHDNQSYHNAANLRLDTWAHLFEGSTSGSVIVPYAPENSPLLYFINTDSSFVCPWQRVVLITN